MSTATGTPVFVSVGGDASAATATYTPSGATTSTTIALGDLAASVASNTTAVATAATNASAAVTTANAAQSTATTAASAAATALSVANAAIPASEIGAASGVAGLDSSKTLLAPSSKISINYNTGNAVTAEIDIYSSGGTNTDAFMSWSGGTGKLDANMWIGAAQLACFSAFPIGTAAYPFSGAVLQSAVQVVSDINDKTIIGTIGASDYTAETTKLRTAWAAISGAVYTLNFSTNKRKHIGVIAQTVQAAFTAQGLDPSDYGLWCSTPKTRAVTSTVDGATTITEEPVYEADGKTQATQQTVRYEELLSLGIFCERLERADLAARVTALEAKSTAAAATTSTASTTA
ncbi:tail fiber domain-containing protein [Acetobacter sp. DmW_043]|uniref:tail fiber domain-containing protein n=1 Tax=Acetobacter sp. DmW_043 TaxID=1670658 RepID=UPI000A3BCB64|nr:tail fiber domain-containing protein [Acetobacter sp. DmW_043]